MLYAYHGTWSCMNEWSVSSGTRQHQAVTSQGCTRTLSREPSKNLSSDGPVTSRVTAATTTSLSTLHNSQWRLDWHEARLVSSSSPSYNTVEVSLLINMDRRDETQTYCPTTPASPVYPGDTDTTSVQRPRRPEENRPVDHRCSARRLPSLEDRDSLRRRRYIDLGHQQ